MAFFTALFTVLGSHIATIIAGALVIGGAYVCLSPNGRLAIRGLRNYLTSNATNNPKIAAGIFDQKIRELREKKKTAVEISEKAHGALVEMCEKQEIAQRELEDSSKKAKRLEERGEHDQALLMARQAQKAKMSLDAYTAKIPDLKVMAEAAANRVNEFEWKITDMEQRKTLAIDNIKKGILEKELSEELAELNVSEIDATIKGIEEYSDEKKYTGIGARIAYENTDTKRLQDASENASYGDAEDFLNEIMNNNNN